MENIKPNLFLIGAAKSGTSTIHDYLSLHGKIAGHKDKEPHYFCKKDIERHSEWDGYLAGFEPKQDIEYMLDSSTGYLKFEGAIENILEANNEAKFLVVLRNPVDRLISHYRWLHGVGVEKLEFWNAIERFGYGEPCYGKAFGGIGYKNYVAWGMYGQQLTSLLSKIESKNLHVMMFEDFVKYPNQTLKNLLDFLNLEHDENILTTNLKSNESLNLKHKKLYTFLRSLKFGKARRFLPTSVKSKLKKLKKLGIIQITKSTVKKRFILNDDDRDKVVNIYREDMECLKLELNKLGISLSWKEFDS
ncbi:sulfotransferase domain-containing protein [Thalassotalea sp. Y01]|uniref:sulfotransferase domain-containing protein n=1 Tax=Thalassotalea sp. Y01 TaxID=2729613 RepID=UPI00145DB470|nr:sulfotransferase domain-containing protein [Thalassotalea sp. Y01]NMP16509.1 sulfotransferase domain-containing protein [Thalassotalea sp. Y01]